MEKPVYLTTTLPYVNAEPHIGFALELVQADAYARTARLLGREVFLNTGTDEHGLKIYLKALEVNQPIKDYVDHYAAAFKKLPPALGVIQEINFIRTTDPNHIAAAKEFWRRATAAGDIYKKTYEAKYCVGCEMERHDSEIVDGHCFLHSHLELQIIEEENYFFRFSRYQEALLDLYKHRPDFIRPTERLNEIQNFVSRGLRDFSISRLKAKMPLGVPVPNDPDHVMYVWFDALVNYISAVGWPDNLEKFNRFWPVIQFAGKDNLRQQAAMWQAMLMSAGLPPSKQIIIHGFITSAGQKMSKSLGNIISPFAIVNDYGTDALRYYLLRHVTPFEDSDFTLEKFNGAYEAHLVNGLGNLTSRIMALAEKYLPNSPALPEKSIPREFFDRLTGYEFNRASDLIWSRIGELDEKITKTEPFKLVKENEEKAIDLIRELVIELYTIGRMLNPIMPATSAAIKETIKNNKKPAEPLFPRRS